MIGDWELLSGRFDYCLFYDIITCAIYGLWAADSYRFWFDCSALAALFNNKDAADVVYKLIDHLTCMHTLHIFGLRNLPKWSGHPVWCNTKIIFLYPNFCGNIRKQELLSPTKIISILHIRHSSLALAGIDGHYTTEDNASQQIIFIFFMTRNDVQ